MSLQKIIQQAQAYTTKFEEANQRRKLWTQVSGIIRTRLNHLKTNIEEQVPYFAKNIYVKSNDVNKSVTLFSGQVPYTNGQTEYGFHISFQQTATGKVDVILFDHVVGESSPASEILHRFDNPLDIDEVMIDKMVSSGIERAQQSSYLFIE